MTEYYVPNELLPEWGPYSKKYMGISKIVKDAPIPGARFDLVVHPMLANMNQPAPNVTFPSSYHVWEAAADLSYFSYRVELEWKDKVYADVSFSKINDHARLVRTEYCNNSDLDQNCVLNYYMAMEYPSKCRVSIADDDGIVWKKFNSFDSLVYAVKRPWDHLMSDGLHRGEFSDSEFTGGHGFGNRREINPRTFKRTRTFGEDAGDTVTVSLDVPEGFSASYLLIRYQTTGGSPALFDLSVTDEKGGIVGTDELTFPVSAALTELICEMPCAGGGKFSYTFCSKGEGGIEFDVLALCKDPSFFHVLRNEPGIAPDVEIDDGIYHLSYDQVPETFTFMPLTDLVRERKIPSGCIEDALVSRLSQADPSFDDVCQTFTLSFSRKHSDVGFYENPIVHSIFIKAGERHIEYALIGDGEFDRISGEEAEKIYEEMSQKKTSFTLNPDGEKYRFSNQMLRATLLTNTVYPIYRHGDYIIHHTPGKRWDCLYTWDSGFIGLGLLECEPRLAAYILDLYLSDPENEDFAFLMHGSPVPVQAYLYLELLQRSTDKQWLLSLYPKLLRYYDFLAGKTEGSTTDPFKSRLTTTFDYFYNCSGMDDLPPQVAMYRDGKQNDCAPALTTSQLIRMAKILKMIAEEEGWSDIADELSADIALRADALQTYAWDEASGYFGYVVHDEDKEPIGVYCNENGENYSKGMDGVYPLVAGVCTKRQKDILLGHIFSEKEMFTPVGISAVDQSASYYEKNGYWNGNVWFSHQWFLWKTMLDLGRTDEAYLIAKTALEAWEREVSHTYYTFEMLNIETGRGGWFHQFGGLSSPVNIWLDAYYSPGTVTCGFDLWIEKQIYHEENDSFEVTVTSHSDEDCAMLFVTKGTNSGHGSAYIDSRPVKLRYRNLGTVELMIPAGIKNASIVING